MATKDNVIFRARSDEVALASNEHGLSGRSDVGVSQSSVALVEYLLQR